MSGDILGPRRRTRIAAERERKERHKQLRKRVAATLELARRPHRFVWEPSRVPLLAVRETKKAGERILSGYASVWDVVDVQKDIVTRTAYDAWLAWYNGQDDPLPLLNSHATDDEIERDPDLVLGFASSIRKDDHGLFCDFRLRPGELGEQVVRGVRRGMFTGLSIGGSRNYEWRPPTWPEKELGAERVLTEIWLREISLCGMPANPSARVTATKSLGDVLIGNVRRELALQRGELIVSEAEQNMLMGRLRAALARTDR